MFKKKAIIGISLVVILIIVSLKIAFLLTTPAVFILGRLLILIHISTLHNFILP